MESGGLPDIASLSALIADPSRAAMLTALLGGIALPATDLARQAGVTRQTASAHLAQLVDGGLLRREAQGRHRYYSLANPDVADMLESLALLAPRAPIRSLRMSHVATALAHARTCYDHLAGMLGVTLADRLVQDGLLAEAEGHWLLTAHGREVLTAWGLDLSRLERGKRPLIRRCLDWSERRPHIAGALGAAITERCLALGWLVRIPGGRGLRLTPVGHDGFREVFGLTLDVEAPGTGHTASAV